MCVQLRKHRSSRKNTSIVSVSLLIYPYLPCHLTNSLLLHLLLDEGVHLLGLDVGSEEFDDLALGVEEELGEVPGDDFSSLGGRVIEGTVVAQEGEDGVCVFPVHFHLLHDGESCLEVVFHKGFNLLGGAALLSEELVAREGEDFETTLLQLLMHSHHLLIVLGCEASLAGHIHHHNQLPVPERIKPEVLAVDVLHYEVEEGGRHRLVQALGTRLEDQLLNQASH